MTEPELIGLTIDFCHQHQPAVYGQHFPDSRRIQGDAGLPDLVLLGALQSTRAAPPSGWTLSRSLASPKQILGTLRSPRPRPQEPVSVYGG